MALKTVFTEKAPPPFSKYSQGIEVPEGYKLVFVSGQVGVDVDGKLAPTHEGQHEQVWRNILAILDESALGPHDIADITAYVTNTEGIGLFRSVRDKFLDGAEPASTLLHISGLASPDWVVEVAVVACGQARSA